MNEVILKISNITKRFPGVLALDKVDLKLHKGEVLALIGENGAGKSTLLKILSGAYDCDEGEIMIDGKTAVNYSPAFAKELGISIIYQELDYFPELTVAENISVGDIPVKGRLKQVDWKAMNDIAKEILKKVSIHIEPTKCMVDLTVGEQQLVEIAKALSTNMKVLVMDEPTSALNNTETDNLLKLIREMAKNGVSIIFISHKLDEVFVVSDRIQVMRDGRSVAILKTSDTDKNELISHMVGRQINDMYPKREIHRGDEILNVEKLTTDQVRNINFNLYEGEVLGIFGLMGSGRTELARALFGDVKIIKGRITIDKKEITIKSPDSAIKNGIAYMPSERKQEGLILNHSVKNNVTLSTVNKLMQGLVLNLKKENEIAEKWINSLGIKTPSINTIVETLSGGNQQKVVIAKWLQSNPRILILNEPTRGIDVGAKVEVYKIMEELCKKGIGIIMISSELPETLAISDRIIIMSEGELTGQLNRNEATQERLMKYAVGGI